MVRSTWARVGVMQMLCGLTLNALVTQANAGTMPVVGVPPTVRPAGPVWHLATSNTRLAFLADQAWLGLFSIGDLVLLSGGILVVADLRAATVPAAGRREPQAAGVDIARCSRVAQRSLAAGEKAVATTLSMRSPR